MNDSDQMKVPTHSNRRRDDPISQFPGRRWEDRHYILAYVLELAKEPSTWRGMIWLAIAFGAPAIPDSNLDDIVRLGIGLVGAIGVCFHDK